MWKDVDIVLERTAPCPGGWKKAADVDCLEDAADDMRSAGYVPTVDGDVVRLQFTDRTVVKTHVREGGSWSVEDAELRKGDVVLLNEHGFICVLRSAGEFARGAAEGEW